MVRVSKLNGELVYVNPDLLRLIEQSPDTVLTFTDGFKLVVTDSPQEINKSISDYRRKFLLNIHDKQQG